MDFKLNVGLIQAYNLKDSKRFAGKRSLLTVKNSKLKD
jgi:hypothetical protein